MIPIRNLYYLLLYAWDALEEGDPTAAGAEPNTRLLDLLAATLTRGVDRLLRRGLGRAYLRRHDRIPGVRGRVDLSATLKVGGHRAGRAVCEFDELSFDAPHNQLLKATVAALLKADDLDRRLREPLRLTWHRLREVADVRLTPRAFRLQLPRNNSGYRFLIDVCRLLHRHLIPDPATGGLTFRDFSRDERRMRALFERFIRNFYRRHAAGFDVAGEVLRWERTTGPTADVGFLPRMRTDVCLRRPRRLVVVDAKYCREPLQQYRGRWTVRSAHLYQLFAYLTNAAARAGDQTRVEGLLVYPLASQPLDLCYEMHGFPVRVRTLNLNQSWPDVHADLLSLLPP